MSPSKAVMFHITVNLPTHPAAAVAAAQAAHLDVRRDFLAGVLTVAQACEAERQIDAALSARLDDAQRRDLWRQPPPCSSSSSTISTSSRRCRRANESPTFGQMASLTGPGAER